MRAYADTSFLVKLLTQEPGTAAAVGEYRRQRRPSVFFLPLHGLEVANAIRQRAFHQRHTVASSERTAAKRERDTSLALLKKFIARRAFIEIAVDIDSAIERARGLSEKHTERIGCRGFDLLHVALALELECESFLTADRVQGALARAEGLKVAMIAPFDGLQPKATLGRSCQGSATKAQEPAYAHASCDDQFNTQGPPRQFHRHHDRVV